MWQKGVGGVCAHQYTTHLLKNTFILTGRDFAHSSGGSMQLRTHVFILVRAYLFHYYRQRVKCRQNTQHRYYLDVSIQFVSRLKIRTNKYYLDYMLGQIPVRGNYTALAAAPKGWQCTAQCIESWRTGRPQPPLQKYAAWLKILSF